jgi:methylmalonyl-CoA mutase, N-terminal domain
MSCENTNLHLKEAMEAWKKCREKYEAKIKPKQNLSGIPIKTVYTPEDIESLDLGTMPGVYPFTRGLYADGYALTPGMVPRSRLSISSGV